MSKVLVTESYLTDIGNAIRSKNSSTDRYKPSEMAGAINDITTQDNTVLNSILNRSISGNYVNDDLTEIGDYAFASCANLTAATFAKVTKVGEGAFYFCRSLESISLPEVKEIEAYSFNYCPSLKSINIPSTIQSISINTFNGAGITTINIDKPADSIPGAPWGAAGALVYWQGKLTRYIVVDLNGGQWVDSGTQVNGHIVYKSDAGSYHIKNGTSTCTVKVSGYSSVTVYARSYAEPTYDYLEVGPLDGTATRDASSNVLTTRGNPSSTTYLSHTFTIEDKKQHTFQILYSKDSTSDVYDDRGYFYIVAE
ncbi:MAG: leucine-rich repeat domain-containing protein [Megasphaera elsdenii]|nr:leucine-rich repeat domain-containing protein [Megasphaera elsdenii]